MNDYKGGYKWSNGVPMTDTIHDAIEKFYEYAKTQGNKETKKEVYAKFEKMLMDAAGLRTEKNYYR